MGCHINLYKVVESSENLESLEREFLETNPESSLFYFWRDFIVGKQNIRVKQDIWINSLLDWYIEPIKGNPELYRFLDKAFSIQCQKHFRGEFSKNYMHPKFIKLENVGCPWIRGGEYDLYFSSKDKFLRYFKEKFFAYSPLPWTQHKEEYIWFGDNFVDGVNLIRLG